MKRTLTKKQKLAKAKSDKKYALTHKKQIQQYQKKYTLKHKQIKSIYDKEYRKKNKIIRKIKEHLYYEKNKNRLNKRNKIYAQIHKAELDKQRKIYYLEHKNEIKVYKLEWYHKNNKRILRDIKTRMQIDLNFYLKTILRKRLLNALKAKHTEKQISAIELIGCSIEFLKLHLEKQFKPGMTWENRILWHVDHIRPCSKFNLINIKEQKLCFHYTNLQPLWANENLSKGNR